MATRRVFVAELLDGGKTLASVERYARNSAIRAGEELIRNHARVTGEPFVGGAPERFQAAGKGDLYRRQWTGERTGASLRVEVCEVFS